MVSQVT